MYTEEKLVLPKYVVRKDDTLVTERKRSNNKHMYKLEASRVN